MNDNTRQLLEQLAVKLGTTVEHLWGVLIRQAPVSGLISILGYIAVIAVLAEITRRLVKVDPMESDTFDGSGRG